MRRSEDDNPGLTVWFDAVERRDFARARVLQYEGYEYDAGWRGVAARSARAMLVDAEKAVESAGELCRALDRDPFYDPAKVCG